MRLTTLGISLKSVNRSLNSEQERPQQYIKIINSTIGILKTTAGISISITSCFTIGSDTTYIELENSTLNISNSVFHDVANNCTKYPGLVFAWGNSKVTVQDTIIQPLEVLAVIINHSELRMKNVSFKVSCKDRWGALFSDKTVIVCYNSSVVNIDTCSFTDYNLATCFIRDFNPDSLEHRRRNWTFPTLNGNTFSNKCHTKKIGVDPFSEPSSFTGCTFGGGTGDIFSYFEDSVVAICNTNFYGNNNAQYSVWIAKHSKLFAQNLYWFVGVGILGTDSQIKTVGYHDLDNYSVTDLIKAQDSNVYIKGYNISRSISFVNSYATIENSVFTGIRMNYGSAIYAYGSMLHIENSTFSANTASNGLDNYRYCDMYLTNSTLSGIYLRLGGIVVTNFSFFNITNSEVKVLHDSGDFNVFVANKSTAHFASTMFLSGQQKTL